MRYAGPLAAGENFFIASIVELIYYIRAVVTHHNSTGNQIVIARQVADNSEIQ
jgi:hypothetical protein